MQLRTPPAKYTAEADHDHHPSEAVLSLEPECRNVNANAHVFKNVSVHVNVNVSAHSVPFKAAVAMHCRSLAGSLLLVSGLSSVQLHMHFIMQTVASRYHDGKSACGDHRCGQTMTYCRRSQTLLHLLVSIVVMQLLSVSLLSWYLLRSHCSYAHHCCNQYCYLTVHVSKRAPRLLWR